MGWGVGGGAKRCDYFVVPPCIVYNVNWYLDILKKTSIFARQMDEWTDTYSFRDAKSHPKTTVMAERDHRDWDESDLSGFIQPWHFRSRCRFLVSTKCGSKRKERKEAFGNVVDVTTTTVSTPSTHHDFVTKEARPRQSKASLILLTPEIQWRSRAFHTN